MCRKALRRSLCGVALEVTSDLLQKKCTLKGGEGLDNSLIRKLCGYIDDAKRAESIEELKRFDSEYRIRLSSVTDEDEEALLTGIYDLAAQLVTYKEKLIRAEKGTPELSDSEMNENMLVQTLLDKNLFTYHFQPIVRVDNGEIFAYEALMRAGNMQGITPFHILKYAELTDRLYEVEQYTFLNVLKIVAQNSELLAGRPVFINSMPNVHILPEKAAEIEKILETGSSVVVEMTENSQYKDDELEVIKEKYNRLGIPIAIDDFGTGYSNISNLLRYTPNFVKIDRSLLSGIENSQNKKHFVREIVDFCHENGIMALAEGVENSEELRTVILLGVDLIQGYYTARPSSEIAGTIPYEIRAEIRNCRQEREDGRRLRIYTAEKNERISLERLSREGYSCIQIGNDCNDGVITVAGSPHIDSGVHIVTADGFTGGITLENARLSNITERPCIEAGGCNKLKITLVGSNRLDNSGILVPASSELTLEGGGDLDIRLGNADYFGIGNDLSSAHGKLLFRQDGTVSITAQSHGGVCIGAGLGGEISIGRGRYALTAVGSSNIGIGSFSGDTAIDILGCDFECTMSGAFSVAIGSVSGNADIHMIYSSIRCVSDSQLAVGIGTLHGKEAKVHAESVSIGTEMSADALAVFGALGGSSEVIIERSSVRISADGTEAIVFGGPDGKTKLTLTDIDITAKISTELDVCTNADIDDIHISGGRYRVTLNGHQLETI